MKEPDPELPSLWAHVVLDPETHTPAELPAEAVDQVNELLDDWTTGYFIERCWIKAGDLGGASSVKVADVHSAVTDEVLVTLCAECLDEEGWI